jgi:hypothetical protein
VPLRRYASRRSASVALEDGCDETAAWSAEAAILDGGLGETRSRSVSFPRGNEGTTYLMPALRRKNAPMTSTVTSAVVLLSVLLGALVIYSVNIRAL